MKMHWRRVGVCLLSAILLMPMAALTVPCVSAASLSVTYTFTGPDAAKAGFAEGVITVTPASGTASGGYYLLYFADDSGLLAGYDELASLPKTGKAVTYAVKEGTLLPPEATKIAVFESSTPFLDNQPSYASHVAAVSIPTAKRLSLAAPNFTFGTTSDIHMNFEGYGYGAHKKWINTLNFFAAQNMDKVIITGDMTGDESEKPMTEQYEEYLNLSAQANYPLEDIHEAIGNHGNTAVGRQQFVQYTGGKDEERPTADSPWFSLKIDGKNGARDNLFIFMAQELTGPSNSAICDNFSKEQMDWFEGVLNTYSHTDTNIYVIEHSPFLNYGPGDRHPGDYVRMVTFDPKYPQNMRLKSLIETHKNIVLLSGHTHLSLYDNINYSTENGTSCRMIHVPSGAQPATYNNANNALGSGDGRHTVNASYGSEAYTVRVYDECIVFTGHNLTTDKIIPAACYILPIEQTLTPDEAFEGEGTPENPYLIQNASDFQALTNGFNSSTSSAETEMYGYGKYFLQTDDIDMTALRSYVGTTATGGVKTYFAGYYNGGGHTLTVDIVKNGMRSVFPYTYGVITNLHMKGRIHADDGAQPVRSLYGHVINCLFEMDLSALNANGLLYSNYSHTYNVYTHGVLGGNTPDAFACSDYSDDTGNLFHWYSTADGAAVNDAQGTRTNDAQVIADAFNVREGEAYQAAAAAMGGMEFEPVAVQNGDVVFAWKTLPRGDVDASGELTTADARVVACALVEMTVLTSKQRQTADMDGNGRVDSTDLRAMMQAVTL